MSTFLTPYTVKYKTYRVFFTVCSVLFEGDELFTRLSPELATQLAAALNGAYNLGRMKEMLDSEDMVIQ